jgi:hypothetical protein
MIIKPQEEEVFNNVFRLFGKEGRTINMVGLEHNGASMKYCTPPLHHDKTKVIINPFLFLSLKGPLMVVQRIEMADNEVEVK